MRNVLILLSLFSFWGCATYSAYTPQETFDLVRSRVKYWEGRDVNELVKTIGYPTRQEIAPSGNKLAIYEESSSYKQGTWTSPSQTVYNGYGYVTNYGGVNYGGGTVTYVCIMFFEYDKKNIIVNADIQGNGCK